MPPLSSTSDSLHNEDAEETNDMGGPDAGPDGATSPKHKSSSSSGLNVDMDPSRTPGTVILIATMLLQCHVYSFAEDPNSE